MKTFKNIPRTIAVIFQGLSTSQIREVARFALFLRTRPDQAYFWTPGWQSREQTATRAKKFGKVIGDGTVEGLLNSLHS